MYAFKQLVNKYRQTLILLVEMVFIKFRAVQNCPLWLLCWCMLHSFPLWLYVVLSQWDLVASSISKFKIKKKKSQFSLSSSINFYLWKSVSFCSIPSPIYHWYYKEVVVLQRTWRLCVWILVRCWNDTQFWKCTRRTKKTMLDSHIVICHRLLLWDCLGKKKEIPQVNCEWHCVVRQVVDMT